jgi:penicillin-binding protein 1A
MAHAYETFSTGGERIGGNLDASPGPNNVPADLGPVAISKISDPSGKTIAEDKPKRIRVLSESVANEVKNILHANILGGTGRLAQFGNGSEWGKTGTTENNGDAWFCGGDSHFTTCVWVGHADSTQSMSTDYNGGPVDGGTFPAYIWGKVMAAIEQIYSDHKAAEKHGGDSSSTTTSSSYSSPSSSYSGSSGSSSSSSTGGGGGGGGGGRATAPAPAPSNGGGGGATSGGTGGTGL